MTKDKALKLALEALHGFIPYLPLNDEAQCGRYDEAITAIKAALEAKDEPYALEASMYSNDRIKVDVVTGNVSIGTVKKPCGLECDCTDVCKQDDYKALWQQMCERCDELDKKLAQLEAKAEPWTQDDTAYRPNGLPQEFIKHEVESPEDWSEWVCPNPDEYFMKCCDCGLVHEVQYRVARYGEGDYCELVEDKDVQAQFRMRRRTPPQRTWVGLTDEDISEIVRGTHNTGSFVRAIEAKLKAKNS